jgi:hypothetical protein
VPLQALSRFCVVALACRVRDPAVTTFPLLLHCVISAAAVLQHAGKLPSCEQQHWAPAGIKQQPVTLLLHLLLRRLLVHIAPQWRHPAAAAASSIAALT